MGRLRRSQLALPDRIDAPAHQPERSPGAPIACDVTEYFVSPENGSRKWPRCPTAASVVVPKAAVDEDGGPVAGEHYIWGSWQGANMDTESEPLSVQ